MRNKNFINIDINKILKQKFHLNNLKSKTYKRMKKLVLASLVLATLVLSSCGGLKKMVKMAPDVRYEVIPKVLEMHGDSVEITVKVTFPIKYFQKKAILEITPVLKAGEKESPFKALVLQGEDVQANNPVVSFTSGGTFSVTSKIAFDEAMRSSELVGRVKAIMGEETASIPDVKMAKGVMATALLLENDPKAIAASDKFVRVTTESKGANIHFVINKADIRGTELKKEEMKALIDYVKANAADEDIEFKGIEISAYASPDGAIDLNTKLAEKRMVNAEKYFARQLKSSNVKELGNEGFISAKSTPEDWEGFKKLMEESEIQDKELILRVLSMYSDPVVREKEIKNIAAAYEQIADKVLPQLRRSKLFVNIARVGYTDEELKEISKSNPDTLKVEELMYAATLTDDNDEKLAIYKKAAEKFPEDWRTHNNVGYVLIQQAKLSEAKTALEQAKNIDATNTTVLNNLGVIEHLNNELEAAKEYYTAAAGAGNQVSYNQAVLATKEGSYENALNLYAASKMNTFNFALAKFLNYSLTKNADVYDAALGILKKVENQEAANVYYLRAVIGARKQDSELLFNNLRTAVDKNASYVDYAKEDIEFTQYLQDETFKGIIK